MIMNLNNEQTLGEKWLLTFGATLSKVQIWRVSIATATRAMHQCLQRLLSQQHLTFLSLHSSKCLCVCVVQFMRYICTDQYHRAFDIQTERYILQVWTDVALSSVSSWSFIQFAVWPPGWGTEDRNENGLWEGSVMFSFLLPFLLRVTRTGSSLHSCLFLCLSLWFPGWWVVPALVPEGGQGSPWGSEIWLGLENLPFETTQTEVEMVFHLS